MFFGRQPIFFVGSVQFLAKPSGNLFIAYFANNVI